MTLLEAFDLLELDGRAGQQQVHDSYIDLHSKYSIFIESAPTSLLRESNERKLILLNEAYSKIVQDFGYQRVSIEKTSEKTETRVLKPAANNAPIEVISAPDDADTNISMPAGRKLTMWILIVTVLFGTYYYFILKPNNELEQEMDLIHHTLSADYQELQYLSLKKERELQELTFAKTRKDRHHIEASKTELQTVKIPAETLFKSIEQQRTRYAELRYYNSQIEKDFGRIDSLFSQLVME